MGAYKEQFLYGVDASTGPDRMAVAVARLQADGTIQIEELIAEAGERMSRKDSILFRILTRVQIKDCGHATPCWVWTGPNSGPEDGGRGRGYPRFSIDGQTVAVHRVLWMHFHGFLPSSRQLDHLCENRMCINPDHFKKVTQKAHAKRDGRHRNFGKNADGIGEYDE